MPRAAASPPGILRFCDIRGFSLPDADKKGNSGFSDPYVRFTVCMDGVPDVSVRSETVHNSRHPVWDADVDLPVPRNFSKGTLNVMVWDDDSFDDGCNADDAMGKITDLDVDTSGGSFIKIDLDGLNGLYSFKMSFAYEFILPPLPAEAAAEEEEAPADKVRSSSVEDCKDVDGADNAQTLENALKTLARTAELARSPLTPRAMLDRASRGAWYDNGPWTTGAEHATIAAANDKTRREAESTLRLVAGESDTHLVVLLCNQLFARAIALGDDEAALAV